MADNVAITAGAGTTIAADEVSDGTLGSVKVQYVKIMDGAIDGTTKAVVGAAGLKVDLSGTAANGTAVKVDNSGVTQPVSGTVTVQQGTASSLKVDLSGTAANTTAIKVDGSAVTQPVSGTVTVQQSTASSLKVDLSGTGANATAIKVDGSAVTQPVSGNVGQSGTWTVQPGNTANTTPWLVTSSHGKTIKFATGSISSAADNTVVSAVTSKRIKVIAFTLITASATAVTATFKDNTAGTAIGTYPLQAITGTNFGVTQAIAAPSFLLASLAGDPLVINLSAAQTVTYTITYFDDDAS